MAERDAAAAGTCSTGAEAVVTLRNISAALAPAFSPPRTTEAGLTRPAPSSPAKRTSLSCSSLDSGARTPSSCAFSFKYSLPPTGFSTLYPNGRIAMVARSTGVPAMSYGRSAAPSARFFTLRTTPSPTSLTLSSIDRALVSPLGGEPSARLMGMPYSFGLVVCLRKKRAMDPGSSYK